MAKSAASLRHRLLLLLVSVSVAATLSFVSLSAWSAPPATVVKNKSIAIHLLQEPTSLNPYAEVMGSSVNICAIIFEPLFKYNDKWELLPELASKVPVYGGGISKDGLVYKIQLRPRVKWHDGISFTSSDVKFTFDRYVMPRAGSMTFRGFDNISQVDAPDPQTVVIRLKTPWYGLLDSLSMVYILPAHILDRSGERNPTQFARNPIGLGPFEVEDWKQGVIRLSAYENYHKGRPRLDEIAFKFIADEKQAMAALEKGDLQVMTGLSTKMAKQAKGLPNLKVWEVNTPTIEQFLFNISHPILSDKRVRRAFAAMLPLDLARSEVYQGLWHQALSLSMLPVGTSVNVRSWMPLYDIDRAKKLLDEAGWKVGSDGVRVKGARRLSLSLETTSGNRMREQLLELVRDEGKRIGMELTVKTHPISRFFAAKDAGGIVDGGSFDIALFGIQGDVEPDVYRMFHSSMIPPVGSNAGLYKNAKLDALLEDWSIEADPKKRSDLMVSINDILMDDLPLLPTFFWPRVDAATNRIHGIRPVGTAAGLVWNIWEWSIEPNRDLQKDTQKDLAKVTKIGTTAGAE